MLAQQVVDQDGYILDGDRAVLVAVGQLVILGVRQQLVDENRHVLDGDAAIAVHVATIIGGSAATGQGYRLDIAPLTLGAIGVDGLYTIGVSGAGSQASHVD